MIPDSKSAICEIGVLECHSIEFFLLILNWLYPTTYDNFMVAFFSHRLTLNHQTCLLNVAVTQLNGIFPSVPYPFYMAETDRFETCYTLHILCAAVELIQQSELLRISRIERNR